MVGSQAGGLSALLLNQRQCPGPKTMPRNQVRLLGISSMRSSCPSCAARLRERERDRSSLHFHLCLPFLGASVHRFSWSPRKPSSPVTSHACRLVKNRPSHPDLAGNPGMCLDWESKLRPFGSQASAQCTEPHQPGLDFFDLTEN